MQSLNLLMSVTVLKSLISLNTCNWICFITCLTCTIPLQIHGETTTEPSSNTGNGRITTESSPSNDSVTATELKPMQLTPSGTDLEVFTSWPDTPTTYIRDGAPEFSHPGDTHDTRGTGTAVKKLYTALLAGYDVRIRPRENQSEVLNLTVMFYPINIVGFHTATQTFSVLGFMTFAWTDDYLAWNGTNHGVTVLKFPIHQVWSPTIFVYKPIDGSGLIGEPSDSVQVGYRGNLTWVPEGIYSAMCEVNIKYYPFDVQMCKISVYASDETANTVDLIPQDIGISDKYLTESSEWKIIGVAMQRQERFHTVMIDYIFTVERRTAFTMYTVIAPIVLLSLLNLGVLLVPIEAGEKVSAAVTLFLAYGVLVTSLSDKLPNNSLEVSYLMTYILMLLLFSVITAFYSIVQARVHAYSGRKSVHMLPYLSKVRQEQDGGMKDLPQKTTTITWNMLFRASDVAIFLIFALILITATMSYFFAMQSNY